MNDLEQMAQAPLGDNILAAIAQTAREIIAAQDLVREREEELKDAQKQLKALQEEVMPELMAEAGQEKLTTADGLTVSLKTEFRHRANLEQRAATWAWLRKTGNGAIIKKEVKAAIGRASDEEVEEVISFLSSKGVQPAVREDVPWQTLGALVKEVLANGGDVPLDEIGGEMWKQANVKAK